MSDRSDGAPASQRLDSIQAMRALAALLVTVRHAAQEAEHFFGIAIPFDSTPLSNGVDLFFVISGFIIYHSSDKFFVGDKRISRFLNTRFVRIVPLYYIFTTLMVMVTIFFEQGLRATTFDLNQIIHSYLFLPYQRGDGDIKPVLALGWTLNYEMLFYGLFSLFLWLPKRRAALCILACLLLMIACRPFVEFSTILRAWTNTLILEFGFGILIGLAYERCGKLLRHNTLAPFAIVTSLGLVALYVCNLPGLPVADAPRFLTAGVPAAVIVAAAVLLLPNKLEATLPRWLTALGDSSYSLYLCHRFVQRPFQILLTKSGLLPSVAGWVYFGGAIALAVAAGHAVYVILERPLLHWLRSNKSWELLNRRKLQKAGQADSL